MNQPSKPARYDTRNGPICLSTVICDGEVSSSAQVVGGGGQCQRADGGSGAQWYARYQAQRTGGCGGDAGEFDGDGGDGADGPDGDGGTDGGEAGCERFARLGACLCAGFCCGGGEFAECAGEHAVERAEGAFVDVDFHLDFAVTGNRVDLGFGLGGVRVDVDFDGAILLKLVEFLLGLFEIGVDSDCRLTDTALDLAAPFAGDLADVDVA